jgi:hypothetical protein|nr:hypothetical protein [uncultured Mediterranean phage uvMED]
MNTIDLEKEIKKKLRDQKDKEYGDYKENMGLIAFLWSVILKDKLKSDVKPYEAANMMVMLKMLRTTRKYKADTYLDASIYLDMAKDLHKED